MKKKIIAIVILIIIVLGGLFYFFMSSGGKSGAKQSLQAFCTAYNKVNLQELSTFGTENGEIDSLVNTFNTYDYTKLQALKVWSSRMKYQIGDVEKNGETYKINMEVDALNGVNIYNSYEQNMENLNITAQDVSDSNQNGDYLEAQSSNAFSQAVQNNGISTVKTDIVVQMKKENGNYIIINQDEVLKALLGGLDPNQLMS